MKLHHEALAVDRKNRRVRILDRQGGKETDVPYDRLLIATGARSRKTGIEGENAENVFSLKDMTDGLRIRRFIDEKKPEKAVLWGAGYISLEIAEALIERGVDTTILYRGEVPYSGIEPEIGRVIVEELDANGVRFVPNVNIEAFETADGKVTGVRTDNGAFPADIVFVGIGVVPNSEIAKEAGIEVGKTGGIAVDDGMRTSDPLIYSAGDCCEKYHRVIERPVLAPLGDTANKEGRIAGENMVGWDSRFNGIVGAACVKVFGLEVGVAGLTEEKAVKLGYSVLSQTVETTSKVGIYPGAEKTVFKLVADGSDGRLLGGCIVGRDGEARKINVLAVALYQGMRLEEVSQLDLAYAPPFGSVWDPIHIAANLLKKKVG